MRPIPRLRFDRFTRLTLTGIAVAVLGTGVYYHASRHDKTSAAPGSTAPTLSSSAEAKRRVLSEYGNLPLAFEPNRGQSDPQVKYMTRGSGYTVFLTSTQAVMSLTRRQAPDKPSISAALQMEFTGGRTDATISSSGLLGGVSNYFVGNDAKKWQTALPQYSRVNYSELYPGIDLVFHGEQRQLEFDFVVKPASDPSRITLKLAGADRLHANADGDLTLATAAGNVRLHRPVAYQESPGGRKPVKVRFQVARNQKVTFALGPYDRSRELVIDPTVSYATYIGGAGEDQATSVAVDSSGNAYITGEAGDNTFPHKSGSFAGAPHDAYVLKLDPTGATLVYSTIFGGSSDDSGNGIAIDASGNAYVAGGTSSPNFPVTGGVFQSTLAGSANAFVAKFNSSGAISYATYLGGSTGDTAVGIAIDSSFNTYVTGQATSGDFPTKNAFQSTFGGQADAFVTELNPTASALVYSTYLGGTGVDNATGIAFSSGKVYVTGNTIPQGGTAFPVTSGVFQSTAGGATDVFVSKLDTSQTGSPSLVYSTLLGGSGDENAYAIVVDSSGNAYVTGSTTSPNFPTASPFQASLKGIEDAFVTKFNATATSPLSFSTYLGGTGVDIGVGIALDSSNNVYVTGQTSSSDFPTASPTQSAFGGGMNDAFVSEFTGSTLAFSSYLGGNAEEDVTSTGLSGAIAVDSSNNIYVVGDTSSTNFPSSSGAVQTAFGGGTADAFAAKFAPSGAVTPDFALSATALSPASIAAGSSATSTVTITPSGGFNGPVALTCSIAPTVSNPPSCSFNPASVNGSGTSTLTVATTSSTPRAALKHSAMLYGLLLPIGGIALFGLGAGRKKSLALLLGTMAILGLLLLVGCSGGGSSGGGGGGGGGGTGTTYTITVTGTSGALTHSQALTLTVQ